MFDTHHSVTFATELLGQLYEKTSSDRQNHVTTPRLMQIWFTQNSQGVSCDRFLRRTHAPRTSRSRFARTRVRTPILWWSHFAPAPLVNTI